MQYIFRERVLFYVCDFQVFSYWPGGLCERVIDRVMASSLPSFNLFFCRLPCMYNPRAPQKNNNPKKKTNNRYPITLATLFSGMYVYIIKMQHCSLCQHLPQSQAAFTSPLG